MKYILYKTEKPAEFVNKEHELIAVAYGDTIDDVTDELISSIQEDLSESGEYPRCEFTASTPYGLNARAKNAQGLTLYNYEMTGIVMPPYGDKNIQVYYGVVEK